jgi:hypothetical protein
VPTAASSDRVQPRHFFCRYDDEGYFLLMVKHYLDGGHLYTEVISQYGPFYTFAQTTFFRLLQLAVTHDAGRHLSPLVG